MYAILLFLSRSVHLSSTSKSVHSSVFVVCCEIVKDWNRKESFFGCVCVARSAHLCSSNRDKHTHTHTAQTYADCKRTTKVGDLLNPWSKRSMPVFAWRHRPLWMAVHAHSEHTLLKYLSLPYKPGSTPAERCWYAGWECSHPSLHSSHKG